MVEFDYRNNFVKFLETRLETWKYEKTLTIVMSKSSVQELLKELKECVEK